MICPLRSRSNGTGKTLLYTEDAVNFRNSWFYAEQVFARFSLYSVDMARLVINIGKMKAVDLLLRTKLILHSWNVPRSCIIHRWTYIYTFQAIQFICKRSGTQTRTSHYPCLIWIKIDLDFMTQKVYKLRNLTRSKSYVARWVFIFAKLYVCLYKTLWKTRRLSCGVMRCSSFTEQCLLQGISGLKVGNTNLIHSYSTNLFF